MSEQESLSDHLARSVEAASPGVVYLEGNACGATGSVWSDDGVVITALHALGQREALRAHLGDGRALDARVVGRDVGTDLAVLRVDGGALTSLTWDDGEALRIGHLVTSLGRPHGVLRATLGMVASLREGFRTAQGGSIDRHIDVDGSLPRGFSGGPLVDHRGRALGMNTAALLRGGVTVPSSTLRRVVPALLRDGVVGRGYLGVGVQPVRIPDAVAASVPQRWGLIAVSLDPEGPASKAGVHVGDVVLSLDGAVVQHPGDLVAGLRGRANEPLALRVARAGEILQLTVTPTLRS